MNSSAASIAEQVDGLLDAATPAARLTDEALRDRLVECERAMAMLQAAQAESMVAMGARARAADQAEIAASGRPMWSKQCRADFVADEIGVLLGCTKMAAVARYDSACRAAGLPVVAKAWRAGLVDARNVAVIGEQLSYLHPGIDPADPATVTTAEVEALAALAAQAIEYATEAGRCRTAPQLRQWLRRKVIAVNPEAAESRRQQAMGDRRVVITPGEDGMCQLWALLPAVQGRQIQQALTTAAQQMGADDARTMDQRRSDTLVDLLLGRARPPAVSVQVIVATDTLTGSSQEPGWVPGLGPVTASQVGELIGSDVSRPGSQVSFRRLLTDPVTGVLTDLAEKRYRPSAVLDRAVRARDMTCRFPGCRRSADTTGTDLDHTVAWPQGPTSAANLAVLCRRHHRLKHTAGWSVELDPFGVMTWTTPTGRHYQTEPWHYTNPAQMPTATDPDPPPDG